MEMEQWVPGWLCADFLHHCLQFEEDKQNIVIISFEASNATSTDVISSSFIYRVKVEYKDDEEDDETYSLSLVIKSGTVEYLTNSMFDIIHYSEPIFYNRFIPEANKLSNTCFVPKSYFSPKFSVVVLEDLQEQGFITPDRKRQLDLKHCRLYVEAASSLHAISFAVHKEHPELVKSIGEEKLFSDQLKSVNAFKMMIKFGMICLVQATARHDKFKKYCSLISNLSEILWDLIVEAHKLSIFPHTLTQGYPWTSNMMFKYGIDGIVKEIKLLDFQALRYGSPVNDLIFFIWTSADHSVRTNRLQELYQTYLSMFNIKLKKLKCSEKYTYDDLMDNIKRLGPMVLFIVGIVLPVLLSPDPVNFGTFVTNNEGECKETSNPYEKYYNKHFCNNHLPLLLEQLELAEVFDYLETTIKLK